MYGVVASLAITHSPVDLPSSPCGEDNVHDASRLATCNNLQTPIQPSLVHCGDDNVLNVSSSLPLGHNNSYSPVEISLANFGDDVVYDAAGTPGLSYNNSHMPVELSLSNFEGNHAFGASTSLAFNCDSLHSVAEMRLSRCKSDNSLDEMMLSRHGEKNTYAAVASIALTCTSRLPVEKSLAHCGREIVCGESASPAFNWDNSHSLVETTPTLVRVKDNLLVETTLAHHGEKNEYAAASLARRCDNPDSSLMLREEFNACDPSAMHTPGSNNLHCTRVNLYAATKSFTVGCNSHLPVEMILLDSGGENVLGASASVLLNGDNSHTLVEKTIVHHGENEDCDTLSSLAFCSNVNGLFRKETIDEVECEGIQHYAVRQYLCSGDAKNAARRGHAILLWHYNIRRNKWFSPTCDLSSTANKRKSSCDSCFTEKKKIRRETHPWLYGDDSVVSCYVESGNVKNKCTIFPSDSMLTDMIKRIYRSSTVTPNEVPCIKTFLISPELRKAWTYLSTEVTRIKLNDSVRNGVYLTRCFGHKNDNGDQSGHMFISSSSKVSCCGDCQYEKNKAYKRLIRQQSVHDKTAQTDSTCRLDYLSHKSATQRLKNMKVAMKKLTRLCQTLRKQMVRLSASNEKEELTPATDYAACELVKKVFDSFTNNNSEFYEIALGTMIEKMCQDKMKKTLTPEEECECKDLAKVFMEQMKSNISEVARGSKAPSRGQHFYSMEK